MAIRAPDGANKRGEGLEGGCDKNELVQISGDTGQRRPECRFVTHLETFCLNNCQHFFSKTSQLIEFPIIIGCNTAKSPLVSKEGDLIV